jgi:hypothetical protein
MSTLKNGTPQSKQKFTAPRSSTLLAQPRRLTGLTGRIDKYEQQARQSEARIQCGAPVAARWLTPAPAASYHAPESRGEAMPGELQAELESVFNADLTGVRLHHDVAAAIAARREQAAAFTANRHIYFGPGQYQPAAETGRLLIAHEVTHVLQQTGRASTGGRVRATDVSGGGEIQRKTFVDYADDFKLFSGPMTWDTIKAAYKGVADFAAHEKILDGIVTAAGPVDTLKLLLAETGQVTFSALSPEIRAFYGDALKFLGHFAEAENLLLAEKDLPTAFRSKDFYTHVRHSLAWMGEVAKSNSFSKDFYPDRFAYAYFRFFLSPDRIPIDLQAGYQSTGKKEFLEQLLDELNRIKKAKGLQENELHTGMLLAFYYLEKARREQLPENLKTEQDKYETLIDALVDFTKGYLTGDPATLSPSSLEESTALFKAVFPAIKTYAKQANAFWTQTTEFIKAVLAGGSFKNLSAEKVKEIALGVNSDKNFAGFFSTIKNTGDRIFAKPGGNIPAPNDFQKNVKQAKADIIKHLSGYVGNVAGLVGAGKASGEDALRFGLVMSTLAITDQYLDGYNYERDKTLTSEQGLVDERQAVRIRLAVWFVGFGVFFGRDAIREQANRVFAEPQQLALLSDWLPDPDENPWFTMSDSLRSWDGANLSTNLIEKFLKADYYRIASESITDQLKTRRYDFSDSEPIINIAIKKADAQAQKPKRHILKEWTFGGQRYIRAGAGGPPPTPSPLEKSFLEQIFAHAKTKAYLDKTMPGEASALAPTVPLDSNNILYLWIVPRFTELLQFIDKINKVTEVFTYYLVAIGAQQVPDPLQDPWAWLKVFLDMFKVLKNEFEPGKTRQETAKNKKRQEALLNAIIAGMYPHRTKTKEELRKEILDDLGQALGSGLEGEFSAKQTEAYKNFRLAFNHERQVLIQNHLKPMLEKYDRYDHAYWNIPDNVFSVIAQFAKGVQPKEDQTLQVTAMLLEIAAELEAAFGEKTNITFKTYLPRYKNIDIFLTLLWGATETWTAETAKATQAAGKTGNVADFHPIAEMSPLSYAELQKKYQVLAGIKKDYAARVLSIQHEEGLEAQKSTGAGDDRKGGKITSIFWEDRAWTLIKISMNHGLSLGVNQGFSLYQVQYSLYDVLENFKFHPGFYTRETMGLKWPQKPRPGDPILEIDGQRVTHPTGRPLLIYLVQPQTEGAEGKSVTVTDKDLDKLAFFANKFDEFLGYEYIGGAGNLIETMATIELEIAEMLILKGKGKAARAAIIIAEVARFFASGEFTEIREKLFENPKLIKDKVVELLIDGAPSLITALLFEKLPLENKFIAPDVESKSKTKDRPKSRLGKLMKFVAERCEEAMRAFMRLRDRLRTAFVTVQSSLLSHPLALRLLEAIPELLQLVKLLKDKAKGGVDIKEALDIANPAKAKVEFQRQIQTIVDSVLEFELPQDIIPLDLAIEVLIEFSLARLGAKGKALKEIVKAVRADQALAAVIAGLLEDNGLSPNIYWREKVVKEIEPLLTSARTALYEEVAALVAAATFDTIKLDPVGAKTATVNVDDKTPELEPYADPLGEWEEELPEVDFAHGAPLPPKQRRQFSREFGHNFEHVRLHRDAPARHLTAAAGALALTSGSHIYLNPKINPATTAGQDILRHELAHVLQQTGPRPTDSPQPAAPTPGQAERGLEQNPAREQAARHMARAAGQRQDDEPLPIEAMGGLGLLPAIDMAAVADRLITELVADNVAINQAAAFAAPVPGSVKSKATFTQAKTEAETIFWKSVTDLVKPNSSALQFHVPLIHAKDEIITYFSDSVSTKVKSAMDGIVLRSIKALANGRVYLKHKVLARNIETYIFAVSGLAVDFKVSGTTNKVTKVTFNYLHLPYLHGGAGLWKKMQTNTEAAAVPGVSAADKKLLDAAGWSKVRRIIEARLHVSQVWHAKEFRLSDAFIKELLSGDAANDIEALLAASKKVKIGTWDDYKNPTPRDTKTTGLWVATHGELTGAATTAHFSAGFKNMPPELRAGRQSHHIPQYLLVEYFRGDAGTKLFGSGKEHLPGFKPDAKQSGLKGFSQADTSSLSIDYDDYDPSSGRGDKLPAISLAAITHQKGRLHINAASSWNPKAELKGQGTQSLRIDGVFWDTLRKNTGTSGSKTKIRENYDSLNDAGQEQKFRERTLSAMKETYSSMYSFMIPALKRGLVQYEIPWFKAVALALPQHSSIDSADKLPKDYNPPATEASVKAAVDAIIDKNTQLMKAWR